LIRCAEILPLSALMLHNCVTRPQSGAVQATPLLRSLPVHLSHITFSMCDFKGADLAALSSLRELQELQELELWHVSVPDFSFLSRHSKLTRLRMSAVTADDPEDSRFLLQLQLKSLQHMTLLEELELTDMALKVTQLDSAMALPVLRRCRLRLAQNAVLPESMQEQAFAALRLGSKLQSLEVRGLDWEPAATGHLCALREQLTQLTVHGGAGTWELAPGAGTAAPPAPGWLAAEHRLGAAAVPDAADRAPRRAACAAQIRSARSGSEGAAAARAALHRTRYQRRPPVARQNADQRQGCPCHRASNAGAPRARCQRR
jgi:hypothetical protein